MQPENRLQSEPQPDRKRPARQTGVFVRFNLAVALLAWPLLARAGDPTLLFHYALDETNGLRAADSSGNERDGILHQFGFQYAAPDAQWIAGMAGGALKILPQAYVAVSSLPLVTNTTWAAWVRKANQDNYMAVMSADFPSARNGHAMRHIQVEADGPTHPQLYWNDDAVNTVRITAPEPTEIEEWNHIALTVDGEAGQFALYVNGELAGTTNGSTAAYELMEIGRLPERRNNYFRGSIDDVRVYQRALSAAEILEISGLTKSGVPRILNQPAPVSVVEGQAVVLSVTADGAASLQYQWLKNGQALVGAVTRTLKLLSVTTNDGGLYAVTITNGLGSTNTSPVQLTVRTITVPEEPIGLVAEYHLDESAGLAAEDSSGNNFDGTLVSFPAGDSHWKWDPIRGSGVLSLALGGFVRINALPVMQSTTWAAWVRRDASGNHQPIISARISPDFEHVLRYVSNASIGAPGPYHPVLFWNAGATNQVRIVAPSSVSLGQWNHIGCTMDGASGQLRLYVNGAVVASDIATATPFPFEGEMRIGRRYSTTATQFLIGTLDDVRIYDRVLSAQEMRGLFEGPARLAIVAIRPSGLDQLELGVNSSKPNRPHRVEYKAELTHASWQEQTNVSFSLGANGLLYASFTPSSPGRGFYRVAMLPAVPIFFDDFESGAAGWTHGGAGDNWELGTPTTGPGSAFSGTNVFATGLSTDTLPNADAFLRSPPINLAGVATATLRFMEHLKIDPNPDYHRTVVQVLDASTLEVLEVLATKAGTVLGWTQRALPLGAASLGRTVILEFRIITDEFFMQNGWYVEDIAIDPE